jgi:hypothetical protein
MNESCGLQGVVRRVCSEARSSDSTKLMVDQRQQAVVSLAVAVPPLPQEHGDFVIRSA